MENRLRRDWFDRLQINFQQAPDGFLGIHAFKSGHICSYFEVPEEWAESNDFFQMIYARAQEQWSRPFIYQEHQCPVCHRGVIISFHFRYKGKLFCRWCGSHYQLNNNKIVITRRIGAKHGEFLSPPARQPTMFDSIMVVGFGIGPRDPVIVQVCMDGGGARTLHVPISIFWNAEFWKEIYRRITEIGPQPFSDQDLVCPVCGARRGTFLRHYRDDHFCGFCGTHLFKEGEELKIIALNN